MICGCSASNPADDPLQRMQREIDELKMRDEALKKDYDEMKKNYDKKIMSLEKNYGEEIEHLKQQLASGRNLALQTVEVPVAFSTRLAEDTGINESPVIFDVVDLNIGDGYDEFTGVFRPPVNGVYVLRVYGLLSGSDDGNIYIKQNDNYLCHGYLLEQRNTAMCTAIAELSEGDSVRVTGNGDNPSTLRGGYQSGFTGFLIYDS